MRIQQKALAQIGIGIFGVLLAVPGISQQPVYSPPVRVLDFGDPSQYYRGGMAGQLPLQQALQQGFANQNQILSQQLDQQNQIQLLKLQQEWAEEAKRRQLKAVAEAQRRQLQAERQGQAERRTDAILRARDINKKLNDLVEQNRIRIEAARLTINQEPLAGPESRKGQGQFLQTLLGAYALNPFLHSPTNSFPYYLVTTPATETVKSK